MRLTEFTDLALRLLMYLGTHRDGMTTVDAIAVQYGVSRNHLAKVVNELAACGVIETVRGRCGGMRLARDPREILLGELVSRTEPNFHMAQCFDAGTPACPFAGACRLRHVLAGATAAYLEALNRVSLADVLLPAAQAPALAPPFIQPSCQEVRT